MSAASASRRRRLIASLLASFVLAGVGRAGAADDAVPVSTDGSVVIGAQTLRYVAEAGWTAVPGSTSGEPHARMFYVAYRMRPVGGGVRPLLFVWNGGPGSPSATLHFRLVGPWCVAGDRLAVNPDGLLAAADVVVVDAVGTGFSRLVRPEYAEEFYGTPADARAFTDFVRVWRSAHRAESAPLFLMGESFGAGRAGAVAYRLEKEGVRVAGLALVSGALGLPNTVPAALATALRVADYAQTAFYHRRTAPELGRDRESVGAAAEAWARATYAPALERAQFLTDDERAKIVEHLAALTGMPAAQVDPRRLQFSPRAFRTALGASPAEPLNALDMRVTQLDAREPATVIDYLRSTLRVATPLRYLGIERDDDGSPPDAAGTAINERWDWSTAKLTPEEVASEIRRATEAGDGPPRLGPPLPSTAEAMALDPDLRVLIATGEYDSYSSCLANRELVGRLPEDLHRRVAARCYDGGHMMYLDAEAKSRLGRDLRTWLAGASGARERP